MNKSASERQELWDEFLTAWPLEKLQTMSLAEYSEVSTDSSFCYWLESRTSDIGSIWGGSAFKFGVYARRDKADAENTSGRCYLGDYGWLEKYGATPEEAFVQVRSQIVYIAQAARKGDLTAIEESTFGNALKWKLAFLYQKPDEIVMVPIFKPEYLKLLFNNPPFSTADCHKLLLTKLNGRNIFEFANELWAQIQGKLAEQATPDRAFDYLKNSTEYQLHKEPTSNIAGFQTSFGNHAALSIKGQKAVIYLELGNWQGKLQQDSFKFQLYEKNKGRNSNIDANAPNLALGNAMLRVTVPTMESFMQLCEAYADQSDGAEHLMDTDHQKNITETDDTIPLNQILYGPPGTGKTYATTEKAVGLAEPNWLEQKRLEIKSGTDFRKALKFKYDELVNQGRIVFTTFHQSFSYEDFMEGIRAVTDEAMGTLSYEVVDGVFKQLCNSAKVDILSDSTDPIDLSHRRMWKMSLGNTLGNEEYIYEECIENNYILLGWGQDIDFTSCSTRKQVRELIEEKIGIKVGNNNYEVTAVNQFRNDIKPGDLIVVSDGNHKFRAIAEVTSDYKFLKTEEREDYQQQRSVNWLRQYSPSLPKERLFSKSLSQMTLYELRTTTIDIQKLKALLSKDDVVSSSRSAHVLIIDEINRGNLSRIFGELITLLEPDKRAGGADQRSVTLPYSKEVFSVPNNLYVLGTMNTADKSLSQVDLALRRRFEFEELLPQPDLLSGIEVYGCKISKLLMLINQRIEVLLDRDHTIGHSYFWELKQAKSNSEKELLLGDIFRRRVIPLLQEYFFSDWERISWVLNDVEKPEAYQFIQLTNVGLSINNLFSKKVAEELVDRRYQINVKAFSEPSAFKGIFTDYSKQS
jgi:5-methylcytosine-specific restriction protein B